MYNHGIIPSSMQMTGGIMLDNDSINKKVVRHIDLSGMKFGDLIVLERVFGYKGKNRSGLCWSAQGQVSGEGQHARG